MKKIEELKCGIERANQQNIHGITLLALVITIIILIILAGISLNFVLGEDGIIATAVNAREQTKIQSLQEKLELEKGNLVTEKGRTIELEEYLEDLKEKKIVEEKDIDPNSEKDVNVVVEDKYVFLVEKEDNGNLKIEYLGKADNITPKIEIVETNTTTNSATIKIKFKYAAKYKLMIKKVEEESITKQVEGNLNENEITQTFEGLEQETNYTIKIEAEAAGGKKTETQQNVITTTVQSLTEVNCSFSYTPDTWTNDSVTATANTTVPTGFTLQTSKDGTIWENKASQTLTQNGPVYARLVDSTGQEGKSATGNVDKIDKTLPSDATITISGDTIQTTLPVTLTATVTHHDEGSGVNINSCKYILNKTNTKLGTAASSYNTTFNSDGAKIEIKPDNATSWYLHVLTVDNVGNAKETIKGPITITANKHVHIGNSEIEGGCYTKKVQHVHIDSCYTVCRWFF